MLSSREGLIVRRCAGVCREAEQRRRRVAGTLAHQLAQVPFALVAQLGGARVADVRVVRPHDDAGRTAQAVAQMLVQREQRLGHVLVAQVP